MSPLHFTTTYTLSNLFPFVQSRGEQILGGYAADRRIYRFNPEGQTLDFTSERLIPATRSGRRRVLLLFSNPHPLSIQQGMFLAPGETGKWNDFWATMLDAGWFTLPKVNPGPQRLAEIFLRVEYEGPFELLFCCYFSFPTRYPQHIRQIFGKDYFNEVIEPAARAELQRVLQEEAPAAVLTFNKEIYNRVATEPVEKYIQRLKAGEVIRSQVRGAIPELPVFLTYPTGWRYDSQYREYRVKSLKGHLLHFGCVH